MIGPPIEPLANPNGNRATLKLEVGKEKIPVSLVHSGNTIVEARPEQDPLEEAMNITWNTVVAFYPGVYRGVIYIFAGKAVNVEI